jgi:Zn-dependent M28 family amino/carboxypeptidase
MHFQLKNLLLFFLFLLSGSITGQQVNSEKLLRHIEYLSSDELAGRKPESEGSLKAREYILNEFKSYVGMDSPYPDFLQKFSFQNSREKKTYDQVANVVAFIPGKSSRKLIVFTAHYDHVGIGRKNLEGDSIYNGADDNASGTSALLALAAYFTQNRPEHSMIFAAVDAEEMGLQGAKALVRDFPYPLDQIVVNINMDMVGRNDQNELYASGTSYNSYLKPILEKASAGLSPQLKFGHDTAGTGRQDWTKSSDHGAFYDAGVPHIYFGVEDHEDYHKPSDEFRGIQPEFFVNAVNLILKCVVALDLELAK